MSVVGIRAPDSMPVVVGYHDEAEQVDGAAGRRADAADERRDRDPNHHRPAETRSGPQPQLVEDADRDGHEDGGGRHIGDRHRDGAGADHEHVDCARGVGAGPRDEPQREAPGQAGLHGAEGAMVFARRGCATCHGPTGEEGPSIALVGGDVTTRTNYWPIRHWPFAPSIWDYIRRVMPYDRPGILTDGEAYAVTGYLLYRNDIISEEDVMDAQTLPQVRMPRRDDYVMPGTWTPETRRGFRIEPDR